MVSNLLKISTVVDKSLGASDVKVSNLLKISTVVDKSDTYCDLQVSNLLKISTVVDASAFLVVYLFQTYLKFLLL